MMPFLAYMQNLDLKKWYDMLVKEELFGGGEATERGKVKRRE
jgi:hypothetical protein